MRVFLIVLDSLGAGYLPDAELFGDVGANTLLSVSKSPKFNIPNLRKMGIGNIEGLSFLGEEEYPTASYGICAEMSMGKDTVIGHWEIAGVVSPKPFPTYPNGFPKEIIDEFEAKTKRKAIVNRTYSGTDVIRDYGEEARKSGSFIVYTSADSVFQIAAHTDVIPLDELYRACEIARNMLVGENAVGRVIARPYTGVEGSFVRTSDRHDYALEPSGRTVLDEVKDAGMDVVAVGKIFDIFAGRGITRSIHTEGNTDGMNKTLELVREDFNGLCFVNLVDFDMLYGHRRDRDGYAEALSEFDGFLPSFMAEMKRDDYLIITADHGCDPDFKGTDHTREYIPMLLYGKMVPCGYNAGTAPSYTVIADEIREILLPYYG